MDYYIQPGDTLAIIANRFGTTVEAILSVNPRLQYQNYIFPGQIIHIPVPGEMPVPRASLYIVQPGETINGLAARFNVPPGALLQANPQIINPNLVFPGQIIAIPLPYGAVVSGPSPMPPMPPMPPFPPVDP